MKCNAILYVRDQQRATTFCETVLRRKPTLNDPGMTEFHLSESHVLGLMPETGMKRLLGEQLPDSSSVSGIPRSEIYLTVEDPEQHHRLALMNGAKELSPLELRNSGIGMDQFRTLLPTLGADRLAGIAWIRAQQDNVLSKALMASICLRSGKGDWEKAKSAIEYALHFRDFVRYTEGGHGAIIDEVTSSLQALPEQGQREFALRAAKLAAERAQNVAENFEDDWDWTSSLGELNRWIETASPGGE